MLDAISYSGKEILEKYVLENSCGEGNILIHVIRRYIEAAEQINLPRQQIKEDLEKYIIGFEIDIKTIEKCIKNLDNEARKYGIDGVRWNVKNADYLRYTINEGIDFIIGNPPYIMYQNLQHREREFLKENFESCTKGKFDYCYAFIEKSIKELSTIGMMSYIVPSSIFKNVFGKELRKILAQSLEKIYDYKESVVFNNVLTSPAIICINKNSKKLSFRYYDVDNLKNFNVDKQTLGDKWLFLNQDSTLNSSSNRKFKDYFKVSNSVATLLNSVFIINEKDILLEDDKYIEVKNHRIEKSILRPAASPRGTARSKIEYIIFPYGYAGGKLVKFDEQEIKLNYPGAYKYLLSYFDDLNARTSDNSAKWFEYGRSQALLHLNQEKILLSSVITNEVNLYRLDQLTIPYSGFYIVPISNKSLGEAEEILNSQDFFSYLSVRGINANGRSLRFSVNDILNYPIDNNRH
ncbi:Eco57I restriction-modification methylase domain-containing protein [Paenibacillus chitinolyticus]|uniref:Eco57I restriction-modification methylase domain-containing protein n=1 Tax=Paenibacillus chitinolyticus TaxID=79263 RepID=UPI00366C5904